ncbi:Glycine oxidase [Paenibacillus sp. JJ-100]|uniref:NAD(P)/FAD-dependent oxidoreductase n=1 Tax=Paenibacillus sp. JJ-100 TaxID=2974896 RepID=UPI0022FF768B|nr:FAD-dependent oxidoreductase [Paenibacillus sp. JJ-100]CAI6043076.1 Glycine oxidase [Paenibacillus sp. JJ-100]
MKKVIVIGAGILGASTAYHLAKSGAEVLLVDRKDTGQATDAAAGIICPWLSQRRNQDWYQLAKAGARYYPGLIAELERDGETETGYAQTGALSIHTDHDKLNKLVERAKLRREDAPEMGNITWLDEKETRERFPILREGYSSVHVSGAARVDGRALRDALIRSAQRQGARLLEGEARLLCEDEQVTGVEVNSERYGADMVVVCAGAWANELMEPLGIHFKVHYQKAQIIHLRISHQQNTGHWPVIMPPTDQYLLAFAEQKMVIGATHENDVEGYDTRITAGGMQEVLNKGLELAPELANSTLDEVRVGFRPFTPGFLPVMGTVPGWSGLITANGLGASGLTMGPYIGSQLAKLAMDIEPDINMDAYDVSKAIELKEE